MKLSIGSRSRRAVIYPFLMATYAVLAFLANNISQIRPATSLRSLLVSLVLTAVLMILLRLALGDWEKAGLLCGLAILLFFTYGHLYGYLKSTSSLGITLGRHRYLLPLWAVILGLGYWQVKRLTETRNLTAVTNAFAAVAIFFPLIQIGTFEFAQLTRDPGMLENRPCRLKIPEGEIPPDIYYIIFDGYSRDDVLRDVYDYDNAPFLANLTDMGFFIARGSQSNYPYTEVSLSSSLNMTYLDELDVDLDQANTRAVLVPFILRNAVRHELECVGYISVALETGFYWTQWEDADVYLDRESDALYELQVLSGLSDFEAMLIQTSLGRALTDAANVLPRFLVPDVDNPLRNHRERILFSLDRLADIASVDGPKLVFAHIVSPHPPYVLDPNGDFVDFNDIQERAAAAGTDDLLNTAYRDQVSYLNGRIEQVVRDILAESKTPPVIIIQGDHGNSSKTPAMRLSILNAYYLPGLAREQLYSTISPVNSFRVVFNSFLGGDYTLLDDISYFSPSKESFEFEAIPNEWSE